MMHQGLMEHYVGQNLVDPGYVVDYSEAAANDLIEAGMKIIFTGHYHATDITKKIVSDKFIFDVETGSTVTYPCTYRMLTITGNEYKFERQSTMDLMPQGFDAYSKTFSEEHLDGYFGYVLNQLYGVPPEYALGFAPYFRDAALAHFAGDEEPNAQLPGQMLLLDAIDSTHKLSSTLGTLWTDIDTPDNNLTINMVTGAVY
jgi:hypothetical protein